MSTVIFAPKTAPKTAPKNIELHLKFMSQNNRLQNMRSNLSSPTIVSLLYENTVTITDIYKIFQSIDVFTVG